MKFYPNQCYHVYNQGNDRRRIFMNDENYLFFLRKMRLHLLPHCRIMAYCLMPNHFHWLLYLKEPDEKKTGRQPLTRKIGTVLSSYTQAINRQAGRTGSLFRQKTKGVLLDSLDYAQTCLYYIHQNPARAGLVSKMGEWPYSSYPDFAGKRNGTLAAKEFTLSYLDIDPVVFTKDSEQELDAGVVEKLY